MHASLPSAASAEKKEKEKERAGEYYSVLLDVIFLTFFLGAWIWLYRKHDFLTFKAPVKKSKVIS